MTFASYRTPNLRSLIPPAPQQELRGLKKKVVEKKKDEPEDYMQRAAAVIQNYVPPSSQAMGLIQLQFKNYLKSGDALTLSFDAAAKVLRKVTVNSYLDDQKDAVGLEVDFQTLPDGTNYAATTALNAQAKSVVVRTQNSNYQRIG
jgi:hypothetical protein